MQVFNVSTGKYLCHNKYFGRGLTPAGFKDAIAQFLNNSDPSASEQVNQLPICKFTSPAVNHFNSDETLNLVICYFVIVLKNLTEFD
jgi:hypothetical protein